MRKYMFMFFILLKHTFYSNDAFDASQGLAGPVWGQLSVSIDSSCPLSKFGYIMYEYKLF
jgi:hypothetical protein